MSIHKQNTQHAQARIPEICEVNISDTAAKLGTSIGLAQAVSHDELEFNKMYSRWVPKHLKQTHVTVC
jgi:hypothetical protein